MAYSSSELISTVSGDFLGKRALNLARMRDCFALRWFFVGIGEGPEVSIVQNMAASIAQGAR